MVKINIQSIKANLIESNSGIFSGLNYQSNREHQSKESEGFGTIEGDSNMISNNVSFANKNTKK